MKDYLFSGFLIVFSFMAFNINAQDFWQQLYFPDTVTIRCITTNDQGNIFIGVGNSNEAGGVYRSTDNAQTWELVYDNNSFGVLSIAIDANGYVYVGKNGPTRFIVSKDNGNSWENIYLPSTSYGNIMKIQCVGQDTIYVSTWESVGSFITFSFDGAETWEYSYVTDHPNEYVSDIDISNIGEVFVSVSGFFDDQGGVYKSGDNGITWEYVGLLNHQVITLEINSTNDVFTGDWWIMNNDTPGINALYSGSGGFELVLDAYNATDIKINSENIIYATANEDVVRSFDNGQTWEIIEDELSPNTEFLNISYDGYLYGTRSDRIVKSIDPIITGIDTDMQAGLAKDICVCPNPVNDVLNVKIATGIDDYHSCEIRIYKFSGELIYKSNIPTYKSGDCFRSSVNSLSGGIYLLECFVDNEMFTSKFIKK